MMIYLQILLSSSSDISTFMWIYRCCFNKSQVMSWDFSLIYDVNKMTDNMRFVQTKLVQAWFWVKKPRLLQMVPTGVEAGIPLVHQLMAHLQNEFPKLLPGPLQCHAPHVYIQPESLAVTGPGRWSNTFQCMEYSVCPGPLHTSWEHAM
jgi:hypothetical protein